MSTALQNPKYESVIKKYFSKAIPLADHKFASLHYAVWS
jgi:Fe-S cluster assembly protein SufB